ncbi:MAG: hypothetical protein LQ350_003052 [Teloschistes chrysophthalmus]|nr:MAG: hypothetical protein LQ350_003052 [Niorma chrysophthalma]
MLPLPGSPSSSWEMFTARLKAAFNGPNLRVCTAFWLFGLINNVLYVIILSAALDLVGPNVPKAVVLLADILPSFFMKLCAPYFIHVVPYSLRVVLFAITSAWGMLLIALSPPSIDAGTITTKMAGVVLASLSSGAGELSFLGLTHYYGDMSLAAWGSGTGGAGLVGAGAYAIATTTIGLSVQTSLLASSFFPIIMLLSFFLVLPRTPLRRTVETENHDEPSESQDGIDDHASREDQGLLSDPLDDSLQSIARSDILPLFLVYIAEYMINQSVAPTLLFPLESTPFSHYRSFYPTYATIYQLGVFVSRSSLPFFRIHALYPPSLLQVANLLLLTLQSLFSFIPSVYIVFAIVFWEGLLGGLVYVNTYAEIRERVPNDEREFALGATTVSDSAGITMAGLLGLGVETFLCEWQVKRGRDCTITSRCLMGRQIDRCNQETNTNIVQKERRNAKPVRVTTRPVGIHATIFYILLSLLSLLPVEHPSKKHPQSFKKKKYLFKNAFFWVVPTRSPRPSPHHAPALLASKDIDCPEQLELHWACRANSPSTSPFPIDRQALND